MDAAKIRVEVELQELSSRINRLFKFAASDKFKQLDKDQRKLLVKQLAIMTQYESVLKERLDIWVSNNV